MGPHSPELRTETDSRNPRGGESFDQKDHWGQGGQPAPGARLAHARQWREGGVKRRGQPWPHWAQEVRLTIREWEGQLAPGPGRGAGRSPLWLGGVSERRGEEGQMTGTLPFRAHGTL